MNISQKHFLILQKNGKNESMPAKGRNNVLESGMIESYEHAKKLIIKSSESS